MLLSRIWHWRIDVPSALNRASIFCQLCMSYSKMEYRLQERTSIIPDILLMCFEQQCIHCNQVFLLLILILLMTIFILYGKVSHCLSFLSGKWVHHLPLGQLRVFILCLLNIWKMESTLWGLRIMILFNVICHQTGLLLTISLFFFRCCFFRILN